VLSRLHALENVIDLMKKQNENQHEKILQLESEINHQKDEINKLNQENKNQKEETQYIKSVLDRLIIQRTTSNQTKNRHVESNQDFYGMSKNGIGTKVKRQVDIPDTSASWAKLEISDDVIGYMDYDTYTVKIYDHASNKDVNKKSEEKKYYFEPFGQLDHQSAKSFFNNISEKAEMTFNVNMWNDNLRNAVHRFLSDNLKLGPVNINLVRVLPMDRVMLFNEIGSSQHFEIEKNWINYKSDKYLKFKFTCDQLKRCITIWV